MFGNIDLKTATWFELDTLIHKAFAMGVLQFTANGLVRDRQGTPYFSEGGKILLFQHVIPVARVLWVAFNGPVPLGQVVYALDVVPVASRLTLIPGNDVLPEYARKQAKTWRHRIPSKAAVAPNTVIEAPHGETELLFGTADGKVKPGTVFRAAVKPKEARIKPRASSVAMTPANDARDDNEDFTEAPYGLSEAVVPAETPAETFEDTTAVLSVPEPPQPTYKPLEFVLSDKSLKHYVKNRHQVALAGNRGLLAVKWPPRAYESCRFDSEANGSTSRYHTDLILVRSPKMETASYDMTNLLCNAVMGTAMRQLERDTGVPKTTIRRYLARMHEWRRTGLMPRILAMHWKFRPRLIRFPVAGGEGDKA